MWSLNKGCGLTSARAAGDAAKAITAMSKNFRECMTVTPERSIRRRESVG
jgi:hypothetical protein